VVPFAIGMADNIEDGDAINYAAQFYAAVANGSRSTPPICPVRRLSNSLVWTVRSCRLSPGLQMSIPQRSWSSPPTQHDRQARRESGNTTAEKPRAHNVVDDDDTTSHDDTCRPPSLR
jgi:hypothetical protein